jgi:hypothetical protein
VVVVVLRGIVVVPWATVVVVAAGAVVDVGSDPPSAEAPGAASDQLTSAEAQTSASARARRDTSPG